MRQLFRILRYSGGRAFVSFLAAALFSAQLAAQTLPAAVPMPAPEIQYLDQSGLPLAGSKLCTYSAGTNNPLATYTDSTAMVQNTNPVVLDAAGRASVWIGAAAYKFVLRTGGDATCVTGTVVWTQDQVADTTLNFVTYVKTAGTCTLITYTDPLTGGVSRTCSARLADRVDLKDFGALCDGSTDDHVAIQLAINSLLTAGGGTLDFPIGTCNIGTVGLTIPSTAVTAPGVLLQGHGFGASTIKYTGTVAAITIGVTGGFTYQHAVEGLGIDISTAGINAIGLLFQNCLFCSMRYARVASSFNSATSRQIGVQLSGGVQGVTFGAYFKWDGSEVRGTFYRGVYITGELSWGYNSSQFIGGAIVNPGAPVAGTIGLWLHQGNQNVLLNTDIENFAIGIQSDAFDNSWIASRTEGNTLGFWLTVRSGDCCAVATSTTGGEFNRILGGSHGDGLTNDAGLTAQIWATFKGANYENHITGNAYLDTSVSVPGNNALIWTAVGGGSSGLFWKNGTGANVDGVFSDATGILHYQLGGVDYLLMNPNESPVRGVEFAKGIYRNGAGFQHIGIAAATVCTTAAAIGAKCTWTITWNTTWADTSYNAVCSIGVVNTGVPVLNVESKSTTQITGQIIATSAVAANAGVTCIGIHF